MKPFMLFSKCGCTGGLLTLQCAPKCSLVSMEHATTKSKLIHGTYVLNICPSALHPLAIFICVWRCL